MPNAVNAAYKEGDFLDFYARTESTSVVQGESGSRTEDATRFRLTLGKPQKVAGTDLFPLTISGRTNVGGLELAPRWKFIGSAGGKLLGSLDGQTLQTLYSPDGVTAGFFATRDVAIAASVEATDLKGDYVQGAVVRVGNAKSTGGCQIIVGVKVCDDDSQSISSYEYFKTGAGPVGFLLSSSSSSNAGGFFTSFTRRYAVELVGTSLAADGITFGNAPTEAGSMGLARENALATVQGGKIYVFGRPGGVPSDLTGESSIEVYDPVANSWAAIGNTPYNLEGYVVTTLADKSYFVGNGATRVYDHASAAWSTPNTSNPVATSGSNNGLGWKLDVRTDSSGQSSLLLMETISDGLDTRYVIKTYSLATNSWSTAGEFTLSGRYSMDTMSVIGNSVFITAGRTRSPIRIDLAALQYTATGLAPSPNNRTSSAAAVELNGKVYCFGGRGVNSSNEPVSYRRESEYYDTAADTWTVTPKLLVARDAAAAVTLNSKLYVIGGRTSDGKKSARVEVFGP